MPLEPPDPDSRRPSAPSPSSTTDQSPNELGRPGPERERQLPGAVASSPLDHCSEVPFAPWCLVLRSPPVRVVRPLFVLPLVSFRSSFGGPAPGGLPRPAACAAGRLASPPTASAGPQVGSRSTSSTPGAVGRCRSMRIRGERRKGGGVIPVDGAPLERAVVAGGTQPLADGTVPARAGDPAAGDRRGDGRAVLPAVPGERHRAGRGGALDAGDASSAGSRRWPQGPTSCTWRCTRGKCAPAAGDAPAGSMESSSVPSGCSGDVTGAFASAVPREQHSNGVLIVLARLVKCWRGFRRIRLGFGDSRGHAPAPRRRELERTNRPGKTVWECAADDVDRAETRLLDAMATGDDAQVAEAADHLASVQRRSGRLRKRTDAGGQRAG